MRDSISLSDNGLVATTEFGTIRFEPTPPANGLTRGRRPEWLRVKSPDSPKYRELRGLFRGKHLHTVCEEAMCPNIGECWGRGTATFLLMGDTCTRSCGFCKIKTGRPGALDPDEPRRVAESVRAMGLNHAVLTSVNRDEQADGGAWVFAESIYWIRQLVPGCTVEVLIPDFKGVWPALQTVMAAKPEILNHNTETVPRLYKTVRPQAKYERSLELLQRAKGMDPLALTKSGIMLGLGESEAEILQTMADLRQHDVDILTLGQYLQPSRFHLPIDRYVHPDEFARLKAAGEEMGFKWVESGPLVRSSYHADGQAHLIPRVDLDRMFSLQPSGHQ
jgi:lipoyl synthase